MSEEDAGPILRLRVPKELKTEVFRIAKFTKASWTELMRQWIREKVEHYRGKREYREFLQEENVG